MPSSIKIECQTCHAHSKVEMGWLTRWIDLHKRTFPNHHWFNLDTDV